MDAQDNKQQTKNNKKTKQDGFKAPRGRPDPKNRPTNFRPDCLQGPQLLSLNRALRGPEEGPKRARIGGPTFASAVYSGVPHTRFPFLGPKLKYIKLKFSGFRPIFGQTWPPNPSRTTGLVLQCRLHQKSAPQTNSKTISWQFITAAAHM